MKCVKFVWHVVSVEGRILKDLQNISYVLLYDNLGPFSKA